MFILTLFQPAVHLDPSDRGSVGSMAFERLHGIRQQPLEPSGKGEPVCAELTHLSGPPSDTLFPNPTCVRYCKME